jgi:hypothetical protein
MPDTPPTVIRLPEDVRPSFSLGAVVATPGAISTMEQFGIDPASLLARHVAGDWGDLDDEDRAANDEALLYGSRLFSAYGDANSESRIWLITEWDRSVTTFLLPSEY